MRTAQHIELLFNFIDNIRNTLSKYISRQNKMDEYVLKLDGHYYCKDKNRTIAVIRFKNKRTVDKIPIQEIIIDKNYLNELHPLDTCILGVLANNERNGIIDKNTIGWKKMRRSKSYGCSIRSDPILKISGKYTDRNGTEIITLHSKALDREIKISTIDLAKNQALLYSIDSLEAISIGYNISEQHIKKSHEVSANE